MGLPDHNYLRDELDKVRAAAIGLLRTIYGTSLDVMPELDEAFVERFFPGAKALREALGVSVDELRNWKQ